MAQMTAAMASRSGGNARWISSLRLRLALAIAISVALAGIGASGLALRMARRALTNDVRGIAGQAAGRAADQVSRLSTPVSVDAIERTLRQLNSEISEIGHLSYIQDSAGGPVVSGTTGMSQGEVGLGLAVLSIKENRTVFSETIDTIRVASPVLRDGQTVGAVLVRADLGAVIRLQQRAFKPSSALRCSRSLRWWCSLISWRVPSSTNRFSNCAKPSRA